VAEDAIATLRRWEAHGATWRVKSIVRGEAVVELCTCYGDPVDELRSSDPAVLAYLERAAPTEGASSLDQPYGALLDAFAAPGPTPGGGSAAALAAAMAAALVERCLAAAPGASALEASRRRAAALRPLLVAIAEQDAAALAALAEALRSADPDGLAAAAAAASEPATRLRDASAELVELAALAERAGAPRFRGEARCAALLADAAFQAAESIVALNASL
jgi:formiminotetrahydrofolate cyclodeaminase